MPINQRTVLVTGCSSGIGRAIVERLADDGFHVFAGLRGEPSESEWAEHASVTPVRVDVTSDKQVQQVVQQIDQSSPQGLYALVNNAGLAAPAATELTSVEELRQLLEVNTIGVLRMIQAFLPALRRGSGRVVNISSMNGIVALPMVGAYSASKFAMEALSDTLRVELRPWSVPVVVIRPGQIRTAIFDKAREALAERASQVPAHLEPGYEKFYRKCAQFNERGAKTGGQPEAVAAVVAKALTSRRPKPHYFVGWDAWGLAALKWAVPQRLLDRLVARASGLMKKV
ncbi:SDR family oxidoreductase [Adhaeretor mobilis]|uniref:Diacetyl reductase [(S)-acetoin forming] n=1 Tax=Adhaeretor mobilis TaxID=1930276 RepID=A0A517MRA0_9BACT|nr:SDR family oxidoreductase [Adhaeretor mobilis]QDS97396.1 Diacetyl reductase [(S)-acetoin forming] [Adhaeretor mobilis]